MVFGICGIAGKEFQPGVILECGGALDGLGGSRLDAVLEIDAQVDDILVFSDGGFDSVTVVFLVGRDSFQIP